MWPFAASVLVACIALSCTPVRSPLAVPLGLTSPHMVDVSESALEAQLELGERLFFDARLSQNRTISCGDCHDPHHHFSEPFGVSHGLGPDARRRNTPTVVNMAFLQRFGWDARFTSLEDQLDAVFSDRGDMAIDVTSAVDRVSGDPEYRVLFHRAFGKAANVATFRLAIASYERALLSGDSRVDRFLVRHDSSALDSREQLGWKLFTGKAGCSGCHATFRPTRDSAGSLVLMFTDERVHNLGIGYSMGRMSDIGRFAVSGQEVTFGSFKTPSLRDVALTPPYMHDGSLPSLEAVVEFYNRGGNRNPKLDTGLQPLNLSPDEQTALVALLRALTGTARTFRRDGKLERR